MTNSTPNSTGKKPAPLPLEQIQGLIVRGYNMNFVRHFVLQIQDQQAAKSMIHQLISDPESSELTIMSGAPWKTKEVDGKTKSIKPNYALNISFTYQGLRQLDLPGFNSGSFESFDVYQQGAPKRAYFIGDQKESGPQHWEAGFEPQRNHILFSLYTLIEDTLDSKSDLLRKLTATSCKELNSFNGAALPNGQIQFGYRDGISQPNVVGFPNRKLDGGQYAVPAWNFVLKDDDYQLDYDGNEKLPPNTLPPSPLHTVGAAPYKLPTPRVLGLYGSFAAFRVLEQDVVAFDKFIHSQEDTIDPELLAAKLCGRWRSGTPLALSPTEDRPISDKQLNNFNYMKPKPGAPNEKDDPNTVNDLIGLRCPIGAHMRRNNPRNSPDSSTSQLHRIIRRGMPYGPKYDRSQPYDGKPRGLLGLFICASLESQFEFLMHDWINNDESVPDIKGTLDPLLGANDVETSQFNLATGSDISQTKEIKGFPRFIHTKGSAYVFFPSLPALDYIATH